jgi:hypothetical protein
VGRVGKDVHAIPATWGVGRPALHAARGGGTHGDTKTGRRRWTRDAAPAAVHQVGAGIDAGATATRLAVGAADEHVAGCLAQPALVTFALGEEPTGGVLPARLGALSALPAGRNGAAERAARRGRCTPWSGDGEQRHAE